MGCGLENGPDVQTVIMNSRYDNNDYIKDFFQDVMCNNNRRL